jgi:tRNA pseudouridine32 synthase/23S rRNA pseudouridine746 synthase
MACGTWCLSASKRINAPPARNGVGASCVVAPPSGPWTSALDFLVHRFPGIDHAQWLQRLQAGHVIDDTGTVLAPDSVFTPKQRIYYFRAVAAEPPIPFHEEVLWQDGHLLVVDKPHFLPVMPSGKYLQETVLVRLKKRLNLPDLVPIHRIDRDTAGLVLFSINPATRDAYHALFRARAVAKTYECIAAWNPALPWPVRRESRIVAAAHFMQQAEVDGPPNALTLIEPMEVIGTLARYVLKPVTGQRHQLRVHMAALGLPIVNDGMYPEMTPEGADYSRPLQLLAKGITFTDPVDKTERTYTSKRSLLPLSAIDQAH